MLVAIFSVISIYMWCESHFPMKFYGFDVEAYVSFVQIKNTDRS